jgi:hypothetical protein
MYVDQCIMLLKIKMHTKLLAVYGLQERASPGLTVKLKLLSTTELGRAGYENVTASRVKLPVREGGFRLAVGRIAGWRLINSNTMSAAPTAAINELKTSPMDCISSDGPSGTELLQVKGGTWS